MFEWNGDRKQLISTLWIFMTVNYIYCDVFTLHNAESLKALLTGEAGGMQITEEFLLYFAMVLQVPMSMIVLSRYLVPRINKYANIIAAIFTGSVQSYTLTMGFSLHYLFFSIFEISTAILILYLAFTWRDTSAPKHELA